MSEQRTAIQNASRRPTCPCRVHRIPPPPRHRRPCPPISTYVFLGLDALSTFPTPPCQSLRTSSWAPRLYIVETSWEIKKHTDNDRHRHLSLPRCAQQVQHALFTLFNNNEVLRIYKPTCASVSNTFNRTICFDSEVLTSETGIDIVAFILVEPRDENTFYIRQLARHLSGKQVIQHLHLHRR